MKLNGFDEENVNKARVEKEMISPSSREFSEFDYEKVRDNEAYDNTGDGACQNHFEGVGVELWVGERW